MDEEDDEDEASIHDAAASRQMGPEEMTSDSSRLCFRWNLLVRNKQQHDDVRQQQQER